jgi:hypothetical protein
MQHSAAAAAEAPREESAHLHLGEARCDSLEVTNGGARANEERAPVNDLPPETRNKRERETHSERAM